jgi:hypothetical protein
MEAATSSMERTLIILGLAIVAIGVLWPWLAKLGLGHLPGDIYIQGENSSFYFPITTCILVSVVLSLVIWLINR